VAPEEKTREKVKKLRARNRGLSLLSRIIDTGILKDLMGDAFTIETALNMAEGLSDGDFMILMSEVGFSAEDIAAYYDTNE